MDWNHEAEGNSESQAGQGQGVGKKLGFGVGEDQTQQQVAQDSAFQRGQGQTKMEVTGEKQHACEQFDHKVARRDGLLAGTALSPENQPAQHRQVVIERDHFFAVRASGTRRHD